MSHIFTLISHTHIPILRLGTICRLLFLHTTKILQNSENAATTTRTRERENEGGSRRQEGREREQGEDVYIGKYISQ